MIEEKLIAPVENAKNWTRVCDTDIFICDRLRPFDLTYEYEFPGWEGAIYYLAERDMIMPTPSLFMEHIKNVLKAMRGEVQLYDGTGSKLSKERIMGMWGDKFNYSQGIGLDLSSWLDAQFVASPSKKVEKHDTYTVVIEIGDGFDRLLMRTNHRVVEKDGKKVLEFDTYPLEEHLDTEGVGLIETVNSQGFPVDADFKCYDPEIKKEVKYRNGPPYFLPIDNYEYIKGTNFMFIRTYGPGHTSHWFRDYNPVARVMLDRRRFTLSCDENPNNTHRTAVMPCIRGKSI